MYILASDFFEKDDNTYSNLEIRVVCREFLAFKYHLWFNFIKVMLLFLKQSNLILIS